MSIQSDSDMVLDWLLSKHFRVRIALRGSSVTFFRAIAEHLISAPLPRVMYYLNFLILLRKLYE
jgi:hypothetical protein